MREENSKRLRPFSSQASAQGENHNGNVLWDRSHKQYMMLPLVVKYPGSRSKGYLKVHLPAHPPILRRELSASAQLSSQNRSVGRQMVQFEGVIQGSFARQG